MNALYGMAIHLEPTVQAHWSTCRIKWQQLHDIATCSYIVYICMHHRDGLFSQVDCASFLNLSVCYLSNTCTSLLHYHLWDIPCLHEEFQDLLKNPLFDLKLYIAMHGTGVS